MWIIVKEDASAWTMLETHWLLFLLCRETDMNSEPIIEMEEQKTTIFNPKVSIHSVMHNWGKSSGPSDVGGSHLVACIAGKYESSFTG